MTSCSNNIQIVFAPLPEDRDVDTSAAKEFAVRAAERFQEAADGESFNNVGIHHLVDWNTDELLKSGVAAQPNENCGDKDALHNSFVVFLISCGPDGSVHRSVRKTTKRIKEYAKGESTASTVVVALLGHAVCKTSAEQMEDEIYSSGRRLAKALQRITEKQQQQQSSASEPKSTALVFLLETQVELESPEEKFDGWTASLIDLL